MNLRELMTQLSFGVLSNLAIGGEGSGVIPASQEQRLVRLIEQSLLALFGRFNLIEKDLYLRTSEVRTVYPLQVEHARTNPLIGVEKFILDTAFAPFTGDVLKILEVADEDGRILPLNDAGDPCSVFTPSFDVVQVPQPGGHGIARGFTVVYQARHPRLVAVGEGALQQRLLVPDVLVPALEAHVAYQVISPMNGAEHAQKGAELLSRYEMICAEVESRDLATTSIIQTNSKFEDRGFA